MPHTLAAAAGVAPVSRTTVPPAHQPETEHGRLELLGLAGRGTFADVWQVYDRRSGQLRAMKQLRSDRLDQASARRLLENEAEVGVLVSSDYVVRLHEAHLDAAAPYLLMEWLSGETLEARLARDGRLSCRDAVWYARQCAQGMHALLVAGYAHGDIKPSNLFVCVDGAVKLIDLGFTRPDRMPPPELTGPTPYAAVTGTPDYLAPEVLVSPNHGGIERDVYALGVTLYRLLTGVLPFQGQTVSEVLKQQQQSVPQPLRTLAPHVPREVSDVVHRLLSKQPLRRGGGLSWLVHELIRLELLLMCEQTNGTG